jgi:hypothetical protein
MYGAVSAARYALESAVSSPALLLAVLVAIGASVYVACCLTLDREGVRELVALLGNG